MNHQTLLKHTENEGSQVHSHEVLQFGHGHTNGAIRTRAWIMIVIMIHSGSHTAIVVVVAAAAGAPATVEVSCVIAGTAHHQPYSLLL